jgi:site-specific recombinase XerD
MKDLESPLAADIEAFLAFKRARGNPYQRAEHTLRSFDRVAARQAKRDGELVVDRALAEWLAGFVAVKPVSVTNEIGVIRQLCRFIRRRHPGFFVPGREWAPQPVTSSFLPYIFTTDEIRGLLADLDHQSVRWRKSNLPLAIQTLVLILYCTGIRFGEAVRLRLGDIDRDQARFLVQSKGRQRWVPFEQSLARKLSRYLKIRSAISPAHLHSALFVRPNGRAYSAGTASKVLRQVFRSSGLKPSTGRIGPRPYDFRATFAVHRLTHWYRKGADLHAMLPWLSAYMGHQDIIGTEVYLVATPELLQTASRRFARYFRARRDHEQ